ncbi:hypothetical protein [Xanthomonas oryzae]|uniref:hypothetical protein n=1 Tax=Xanthomonas oryzae TaxID=347 RepID=UPI003D17BC42
MEVTMIDITQATWRQAFAAVHGVNACESKRALEGFMLRAQTLRHFADWLEEQSYRYDRLLWRDNGERSTVAETYRQIASQARQHDVPPSLSSTLVWSPIPYPEEIGREEAFFRRTDHRLPARSRGRHADQGPVPAAWLQ